MSDDTMKNIYCIKIMAENSIIKANSRQRFFSVISGIAFA